MNHLANFIANLNFSVKGRKLFSNTYPTKYIGRVLEKFIYEGFVRGYNGSSKRRFYQIINVKYDFNLTPLFVGIKIMSVSSYRQYLRFYSFLNNYFRSSVILLSSSSGLFFSYELIFNRVHIGGESVLKINFY